MAQHLLEQVAPTGLPFILKGGTSLLLPLQEVHRFSIGIDIMVEPSIDEEMIATALRAMMENSTHFIDHEEGPRRGSSRIRHFRFYY